MNKKFWKNKKILITGHTGFKGRWLSVFLELFGAKIYGISLKPNNTKLYYSLIKNVTISAIIEEPLPVHARALFYSWGTLFFSGGASNIRNYLGISGKSLNANFQNNSFKGFDSILNLITNMNLPYFLIFTFTTLFAFISRILGLFGVFYILKGKEWRYYGVFLIEVITFLVASCLYLGQSRFRVPIEPILMLFSVLGIVFILSLLARKVNT